MKKVLSIFLVAMLLSLSACASHTPNDKSSATNDSPAKPAIADSSESNTTETSSETNPFEDDPLPLPQKSTEFSFLSGAGAWRTMLTLHRDGTFTGWYLDSEMGETGDRYPKGSAYTCTFFGKFENIEQVNEYSYKMTLTDVKTEKTVGEEWIEDEIRYIASDPYGLNDPINKQECTEFVFYLPDTPVDQVPEEFLTWWPYRSPEEPDKTITLSCYGILNVTTNYGFFATE